MSEDLFVPDSSLDDAVAMPLHTITYTTSDKDGLHKALTTGLDQTAGNWKKPAPEERKTFGAYLGLPEDTEWEANVYAMPGETANVQIRVIYLPGANEQVRPAIDGTFLGGLSIGFPMKDMSDREKTMNSAGIQSSIGVKEMTFTSPEGIDYTSAEIHFMGPENVFLLGVRRPESFLPVGPIDADLEIGAAAYSARCIQNTEQVVTFCEKILGYEIRRNAMFEATLPSGLRLNEGTPERFIQAFAAGASTGYLVFLDHEHERKPSPAKTIGPPALGMTTWSFPTRNIEDIHNRAVNARTKILQAPGSRSSLFLPTTKTMILEDPDGFPVEIFEVS